ncbi:MAG: transposase [Nitrospirota bacterium]
MKEQTLLAIKNGESVASVSASRGVSTQTIYAWLRGQTDNAGTNALEIAKLRRENQELREIIGGFALEKKRGEKNKGREAAYGSHSQ